MLVEEKNVASSIFGIYKSINFKKNTHSYGFYLLCFVKLNLVI